MRGIHWPSRPRETAERRRVVTFAWPQSTLTCGPIGRPRLLEPVVLGPVDDARLDGPVRGEALAQRAGRRGGRADVRAHRVEEVARGGEVGGIGEVEVGVDRERAAVRRARAEQAGDGLQRVREIARSRRSGRSR